MLSNFDPCLFVFCIKTGNTHEDSVWRQEIGMKHFYYILIKLLTSSKNIYTTVWAGHWTRCFFQRTLFWLERVKDKLQLFKHEYLAKGNKRLYLLMMIKLEFQGKITILENVWPVLATCQYSKILQKEVDVHVCVCVLIEYEELCNYLEDLRLGSIFQMIDAVCNKSEHGEKKSIQSARQCSGF